MKQVKVPELSESVAEAVLLEWQKQPGAAVREGDVLVSVETDKIVMEVYAPCNGVLKSVHKKEGEQVAAGELLASIDDTAAAPAESKPAAKPQAAPAAAPPAAASASAPAAMPSAKKAAAEQGVNLQNVSGTGKGGRITKGDVFAFSSGGGRERRAPMTKLRARIAERLMESQNTTATLTTFNEANMQAVIDLRAAYREAFEKAHGVKLGFMSFFVKAAAAALQRYPIINASVDGNDIVYHEYCDIGVAVGTPRGLVVPILRNAAHLSMADIEKQIADFGARAQTGALSMDEITGGTFSITNGGVFGSMLSTPILNPPQSAILGVHATKPRPIAENGEVVVRPINYLALSYDHRIIDGREAVLFLAAVKDALETPARLLLEV
ncbi:MAG: dihydrolipoyllysine-residue succinyltransferase [Gammaproteobacteria bacterium]